MASGATLTIRPSLVISLLTTTANDDGSADYYQMLKHLPPNAVNSLLQL